jgi:hypothetical protein
MHHRRSGPSRLSSRADADIDTAEPAVVAGQRPGARLARAGGLLPEEADAEPMSALK